MNKQIFISSLLVFIMGFTSLIAQTTQGFTYQAVARASDGSILENKPVGVTFIINKSSSNGDEVFRETHTTETNRYGLFTLEIGSQDPGNFQGIDWAADRYFISVEIDGNPMTPSGQEFLAVPYSKVSEKAVNMEIAELTNVNETAPIIGQVLKWNGSAWAPATDDSGGTGGDLTAGTGLEITPAKVINNTGDTNPADDITIGSNAGGDLAGTYPNPTVAGLQGQAVANTLPTNGQVLKFNQANGRWEPGTDIASTGGGSYSGGTGISVDNNNNIITNTKPDQEVNITGTGATSVSGSYPDFTISSTDNNTTYTGGTGITITGGNVINNNGDLNPSDDITSGSVAGGDLAGTYPNPTVDAIRGRPIATTAPTTGQFLRWTGSQWAPGTGVSTTGFWNASGSNISNSNTGNVGIGITSPSNKLDVNGNMRVRDRFHLQPGNTIMLMGLESTNGAGTFEGFGPNGQYNFRLTSQGAGSTAANYGFVGVHDTNGKLQAGMQVDDSFGPATGKLFADVVTSEQVIAERFAINQGGPPVKVEAKIRSNGAGAIEVFGPNGNLNASLDDHNNGANYGALNVFDANGILQAGVDVDPNTNQGIVFGDVKSFRADHPLDPNKEIWYASVEGPEAAAYMRGTATVVNGYAEISFPEHFELIIDPSSLTISTSPWSADSKGLAVIKRSAKGFEVQELLQGNGTYKFDWEAKAVRKGFENFEVIRDRPEGRKE